MFDEQNPKNNQTQKSAPHPDLERNIHSFQKQMSYVEWLTRNVSVEISDKDFTPIQETDGKWVMLQGVKEYKNVCFSWDEKGTPMTHNVSFHQANIDFQKQLCGALNSLGGKGFLVHKFRENDGRPRQGKVMKRDDSAWEKMFGGHPDML